MNKMIVLHGLSDAFSQAFALQSVGVGERFPSLEDALKYQIAFLMMSGYSANEAIALLAYGVKKGLVGRHGVKWFLKVPNSELVKVLNAVRSQNLNGLGELGFIPRRWIPKRLQKIQVGKAIGTIARKVIAPVAQVTGTVLTATGIGAPIGAALAAGGTLVGTLAREGGPRASDVANAVLGVAAAASGRGTLPNNVQKIVNDVARQNPGIANVANQISAVARNPQVNAAINEMRALIPQQTARELQANVPPNFMTIAGRNPNIETDITNITTRDMRQSSASASASNTSGLAANPMLLLGGVALLGVGLLLSKRK